MKNEKVIVFKCNPLSLYKTTMKRGFKGIKGCCQGWLSEVDKMNNLVVW